MLNWIFKLTFIISVFLNHAVLHAKSEMDFIVIAEEAVEKKYQFWGGIQPLNIINLKTNSECQLKQVFMDFNQNVKKGEQICELTAHHLESSITQSEIQLSQYQAEYEKLQNWSTSPEMIHAMQSKDQAKLNYKQAKTHTRQSQFLYEKGIISELECQNDLARLNQAKKNYAQQKAALLRTIEQANPCKKKLVNLKILKEKNALADLKQQKKNLNLYSPINGVLLPYVSDNISNVDRFDDALGKHYQADENIARIANLSQVALVIKMNENELFNISKNQAMEIFLNFFPEQRLNGKIIKVNHFIEGLEKTTSAKFPVVVAVDIPNEIQNRILFGMSARAVLKVKQKTKGYLIPKQAIAFENDSPYVFVAKNDDKYQKQFIELGEVFNQKVEVLSGVAAGDHVRITG